MSEQEDRKLQAQRDEFSRTLNHLAARLGGAMGSGFSRFDGTAVGGPTITTGANANTHSNGAAATAASSATGGAGFSDAEARIMQQLQVLPKV